MARIRSWQARLLWIDCTAGALVGVFLLLLSPWLARLYGLPLGLLRVNAAANLLYASYSFSLARRAGRPMRLLVLLVCANAAWSVVCLALVVRYWHDASGLGVATLVGESLFVGGLAALEWRHRHTLARG
ncbi:hypothetical protein TBR22_A01080 [Luteitalea sp. TBR-22]|uniref:hypothetical protein n=1 Tax=Luteitalea sp. TBR-22 TaxID=2802971 RepID=UPI001AF20AB2|nr:hypothetical protein [Luteitalea sp. TBR-22]BCS30907.1 hypothetical protein TBR22_A01080 [Luteitalea sp. TBR-22]